MHKTISFFSWYLPLVLLIHSLAMPISVSAQNNQRGHKPPVQLFLSDLPTPPQYFFTAPKPIEALPPISHFTNFDTEHGLALSSVFCSMVDDMGNVWFGTHGGGVSRFDGRTFTNFTTTHGLAHNSVLSIFQDSNGHFWFGTFGGGISYYDGRAFVSFSMEDGIGDNTVFSVVEDQKGDIWLATYGGGISKFENGSFISYTTEHGLANNTVYDIIVDQSNHLWIATNGGLSVFDGENFTNYTQQEGLPHNTVRSIAKDQAGNIWLGTLGGGVSRFDGRSFENFDTRDGLADNSIWYIMPEKGRNGKIWFATSLGLSYLKENRFVSYTEKEGLPHNFVRSISQDRNGNIWLSTFGGGVSRYNGSTIQTFTREQGLAGSFVRSISQDHLGNLWLGTNGNGAIRYDGRSYTTYTMQQGLAHDTIYVILADRNNHLWLGTNGGGVSRFDGRSFTNYTPDNGLIHTRILSILEDSEGNLWFGSSQGVSKFDGRSFTNYTTDQGLAHNFIRSMLEDSQGNIWFATYGNGVSRFDGENFYTYNTDNGFPHNWVRAIWEDKHGSLWFGTYGEGLCRYDGKTFLPFSKHHGLPNNVIYDIVMEEDGTLWVGTNQGLSGLSFQKENGERIAAGMLNVSNLELRNRYTPHWHNINNLSGYPVKNLNSNAMHLTLKDLPFGRESDKGIIWGGFGDNKVIRFNPGEARQESTPPHVVINQILINDALVSWYTLMPTLNAFRRNRINYPDSLILRQHETIAYGKALTESERDSLREQFPKVRFESITPFYHLPEKLVLPYVHGDITISFGAIETGRNFMVNYQYKIEELDKEWRNIRQTNEITFGSFPHGNYTITVRAQSPEGLWSKPASFSFRVLTPWFKLWWMYVIYVVLFLVLIRYIIKWRVMKLRKEKLRLENTVRRRTAELQRQKHEAEKQKKLVEEKNEEILLQKEQISEQSHQLEIINQNLEERIAGEVSKNREKEVMLIQQSRQAAMGEMIGNIAHQWRQPLNAVAVIVQNIQEAYRFGELNDKYIDSRVKQCMEIIQYMSQTIDDFRNFFKPEKNKQEFNVKNVVQKCVSLIEPSFQHSNITLEYHLSDSATAMGYSNEYAQVLLNILKNARDALMAAKVKNPRIILDLSEKNGKSYLSIKDNAGGIPEEIMDKIFHPYFTTKEPGVGTGLGLYMSKTIIEKNMGGLLSCCNTDGGAEFVIVL